MYLQGVLRLRTTELIDAVVVSFCIYSWTFAVSNRNQGRVWDNFRNIYSECPRIIENVRTKSNFQEIIVYCTRNYSELSEPIKARIPNYERLANYALLNKCTQLLRSAIFLHQPTFVVKFNSSQIKDPVVIQVYEGNAEFYAAIVKDFAFEDTSTYKAQIDTKEVLVPKPASNQEIFKALAKGLKYIINSLTPQEISEFTNFFTALKIDESLKPTCEKLLKVVKKAQSCRSHDPEEFMCMGYHCIECVKRQGYLTPGQKLKCPCGLQVSVASIVSSMNGFGIYVSETDMKKLESSADLNFMNEFEKRIPEIQTIRNSTGLVVLKPIVQGIECCLCRNSFAKEELTLCDNAHPFCRICKDKNSKFCFICKNVKCANGHLIREGISYADKKFVFAGCPSCN